jgi:hypothetical protein
VAQVRKTKKRNKELEQKDFLKIKETNNKRTEREKKENYMEDKKVC